MQADWDLDSLTGFTSGTWSATNRYIKANGHNPLEKLAGGSENRQGQSPTPATRVVWPLAVRIGTKMKA